jgi:hypothetical protein
MAKIWSYIRLFVVAMGIALILLVFYTGLCMLLEMHQKNFFEYYKALVDELSVSIYTWNSFLDSIIIYIILLIYYKGKSPFPKDRFWL